MAGQRSGSRSSANRSLYQITRPAAREALRTQEVASTQQRDEAAGLRAPPREGWWQALLSELMYLEATSAYWALQAANPADTGFQQLQLLLRSGQIRCAGQSSSDEYLICLDCSRQYRVSGTVEVAACECGCGYFAIGQPH